MLMDVEIPIAHRVIKVQCRKHKDTGEVNVLTKGNFMMHIRETINFGDDRLLYAHGQLWLQRHHIMGRAVGFLPYVGWVTIIMTEKPIIKYIDRCIGIVGHHIKRLAHHGFTSWAQMIV
ncbi:hypothetical protein HAX54_015087 [Datura stramonium]|uniref:Signal peptidase complex catalytic subunit SEC11 n=1 Tax=Datura stramonium TaxID=4076 RepID=A0ABS8TP13_DATST|nr:hypothetical protein [Datura stramonium]